ncbi:MAG: sensor histidine kinase [Chloroflexi bacterium]|nr:MAG: sensor histidine kinase [Chloroflexota bacterium]
MEQVLQKELWKNGREAHNRSWMKSIRWPLMLSISGILLLAMLAAGLGAYAIPHSDKTQMDGRALLISAGGFLFLWLLFTSVICVVITRLIVRRVNSLQAEAARIAGGHLQQPIPVERMDELSIISAYCNEMASRLANREELLKKAREKALLDSQFKSNLLARVSHDLRQPLGVILGYSEIIRDEIFGPANNLQRKAISEIISSTLRLSQMISDLLDTARLEAQDLHLRIDDFSPNLLLQQASGQMSLPAERKGLAFSTELDPRLPEKLRGDPGRLLQILSHLAGNAIKFTQQGSVSIRAFQVDADHWAISVADTGPGIPADALEFIFEPFHQVDDPAIRDKGGVGLGLAIAQQLVQLMGGCIRVESTVGVGSTFLVTLPLDPNLQRGE